MSLESLSLPLLSAWPQTGVGDRASPESWRGLVRAGDLNCFGKRSRARSRPSHVSGSVTKGVGTDGAKTPRNSNCRKLTFFAEIKVANV